MADLWYRFLGIEGHFQVLGLRRIGWAKQMAGSAAVDAAVDAAGLQSDEVYCTLFRLW